MRVPELTCARIRRTHDSLRWNLQVPTEDAGTHAAHACVYGRPRAQVTVQCLQTLQSLHSAHDSADSAESHVSADSAAAECRCLVVPRL